MLNYSPLNSESHSQDRTLTYAPVRQSDIPVEPQRYVANRPAPEPQGGTAFPATSGDWGGGSNWEKLITEPFPLPGDAIDNMEARRFLDTLHGKIVATKTGTTIPPDNNLPVPPVTGDVEKASVPSNPGTNTGPIVVTQIFQDDLSKDWFATKEGERSPIPLDKIGDRYYQVDTQGKPIGEVILRPADATTGKGAKNAATFGISDEQTRNAMLLIVTTMAVLAAFSIGFLAFDYKRRWEQEVVSQNSRLLGTGAAHGSFAELDSLEPDTLSFTPHDYRSLDDSFDHSFRTIA
jgi:hypothetical protein